MDQGVELVRVMEELRPVRCDTGSFLVIGVPVSGESACRRRTFDIAEHAQTCFTSYRRMSRTWCVCCFEGLVGVNPVEARNQQRGIGLLSEISGLKSSFVVSCSGLHHATDSNSLLAVESCSV